MSLGLLTGYGSDSDHSDSEDITDTPDKSEAPVEVLKDLHASEGQDISIPSVLNRLRGLAGEGEGVEAALALPPPPPPPSLPAMGPLPNPLKHKKVKQRMPSIGRRELELLKKNSTWMDITTTEVDEDSEKAEFEYNTPLPFSKAGSASALDRLEFPGDEKTGGEEGPNTAAEYDYMSYVAEYKNYMANSATLLQGQEEAAEAAAETAAAAGPSETAGEAAEGTETRTGYVDEWTEYMQKYSEWYAQYGSQAAGVAGPEVPIKQKSFDELVEQDRSLNDYFNSAPANEYNSQRDAFKSSFRGTRMYRMKNGEDKYNPKHFNQLSHGAKAFAKLYPKQKSVMVDKDAYVADKDLPENQDPKSMKQRKKDKWFQGMVDSGKGCKKCGYVFCRCYGWEYKPSHCK